MRRVLSLLTALFRDWGRNREAVFFAVLFPLLLLVIFSTVFASGGVEFTVFVQNNDVVDGEPTNRSAEFVDALNETEPIAVRQIDPGQNLTAWSKEEGSGRVLVVPEGFASQIFNSSMRARLAVIADTLERGGSAVNESQRATFAAQLEQAQAQLGNESATIRFFAPGGDQTAPAVQGILNSVVAEYNYRSLGVETPPANITTGTLEAGSGGERYSAADYFLPAFIAALILINGVMSLTMTVAGFSADGTLKRLAATPLRKRDWILATVLHQAILAVVLTGLMIVVAHVLFGVTATPGPLAIALILLAAVGFGAVGMTLGSFVTDPDAASSLANAIAFPLMFLSGVFWEVELMPDFLQTLARLLPVYHFHRGLRRLMITGSTEGVPLAFAFVGGLAVVFLALAVYATRWTDFEN